MYNYMKSMRKSMQNKNKITNIYNEKIYSHSIFISSQCNTC